MSSSGISRNSLPLVAPTTLEPVKTSTAQPAAAAAEEVVAHVDVPVSPDQQELNNQTLAPDHSARAYTLQGGQADLTVLEVRSRSAREPPPVLPNPTTTSAAAASARDILRAQMDQTLQALTYKKGAPDRSGLVGGACAVMVKQILEQPSSTDRLDLMTELASRLVALDMQGSAPTEKEGFRFANDAHAEHHVNSKSALLDAYGHVDEGLRRLNDLRAASTRDVVGAYHLQLQLANQRLS